MAITREFCLPATEFRSLRVRRPLAITNLHGTNLMDCTLTESSETLASAEIADSRIRILMLPSRPLHWRCLLLSILVHALALSLLLSVRLPHRRNQIIDFETSTITYYKISSMFPNVAPRLQSESKPDSQSSDLRAPQEVRIRPRDSSEAQMVIQQPNVRQISALPKLQLPNILMQASRLDPGREPLVVPSDVFRYLATDIQEPQSLQDLSRSSTPNLQPAVRQPALPLPQLAAPASPAPEALQVNQITGQVTQVQQRLGQLPYAAPPVEDFPADFQVENVTLQGTSLLVFSKSPKFPEGSIAVPKTSSNGRLSGSSTPSTGVVLAPDAAELSRADVTIPSISISNKTGPDAIGAGRAVVQAPLPAVPLEPKPPNPSRSSSLLDFLPSRIPSSKPLTTTNLEIGSGESPLRDYESRGGPVYTAAINAPNFTSKRGSWIFRFAELSTSAPSPDAPVVLLTAPSAVVKVDPKYSPDLVREKLEGVVVLFAILRKDGAIDAQSVRVIRKLDNRLDVSARDALLSWRFRPSQRNGIPVDIQMEVSIPFYFRNEGL